MGFPCRFKSDFPHQCKFYRHFRATCSLDCTLDKMLNRNIWENKVHDYIVNKRMVHSERNGPFCFLRFSILQKSLSFLRRKSLRLRRLFFDFNDFNGNVSSQAF